VEGSYSQLSEGLANHKTRRLPQTRLMIRPRVLSATECVSDRRPNGSCLHFVPRASGAGLLRQTPTRNSTLIAGLRHGLRLGASHCIHKRACPGGCRYRTLQHRARCSVRPVNGFHRVVVAAN
jgi:hypothetical protein